MDQQTVSIILPCMNSGEHLEPAIKSILQRTQHPFELIIVESESTDGTDKICDNYAKSYPDIVKVFHTKKEGITKALNFGIKQAGDKEIYLTQDDVILPNLYGRDWLTELVKLSKQDNCGLVTTINAGGTSGPTYLDGFRWVGTWSLFIPRKTIEKVGLFDENFSPGPGDDIDYSYRVIKEGLNILVADFWVDHHRMTENFNDQIEHQKLKNAGYFRKKHGVQPYWEEFEFDGEKYLLEKRTKDMGGCFNANKDIDSPETCRFIREFTKDFKEDDVFLDIGAHSGLLSLMVKKGTVYAFEPVPINFEVLTTNLAINPSGAKYKPLNKAIHCSYEPYRLKIGEDNTGASAIITGQGKDQTITIDGLTLEGNIKLVKIDTEGNDLNVIKGMRKTIEKHKPVIIVEDDSKLGAELKDYHKAQDVEINKVWRPK